MKRWVKLALGAFGVVALFRSGQNTYLVESFENWNLIKIFLFIFDMTEMVYLTPSISLLNFRFYFFDSEFIDYLNEY